MYIKNYFNDKIMNVKFMCSVQHINLFFRHSVFSVKYVLSNLRIKIGGIILYKLMKLCQ